MARHAACHLELPTRQSHMNSGKGMSCCSIMSLVQLVLCQRSRAHQSGVCLAAPTTTNFNLALLKGGTPAEHSSKPWT
jgi:hypothetical protein